MNATVPVAVPAQTSGQVAAPALPKVQSGELIFVQLAREIAMDIQTIDVILKNHEISDARWQEIKVNHRFNTLLEQMMIEWNSALNTGERVRIKALSLVEEALPEFYGQMHNKNESLPAKVKALEVIGKIGGVGINNQGAGGPGGEKFNVTINLGSDQKLVTINAPMPAPQVAPQVAQDQ
jgi:hypothetical protein